MIHQNFVGIALEDINVVLYLHLSVVLKVYVVDILVVLVVVLLLLIVVKIPEEIIVAQILINVVEI
jgi:hypothetical protein